MPFQYKYLGDQVMKYHALQVVHDGSTLMAVPGGTYTLKTEVPEQHARDFELIQSSAKAEINAPAEEPVKEQDNA